MITRRRPGQSRLRAIVYTAASFSFVMLLAMLLLLLLARGADAYTLLPLPASSKAAARSWGKLRIRLLGSGSKPGSTVVRRDAGGPNASLLQDKRSERAFASAPSPPTAQVVPPEVEEGGVEIFMGELGKIDEAMMVRVCGGGRGESRGRAVMMLDCSDCFAKVLATTTCHSKEPVCVCNGR